MSLLVMKNISKAFFGKKALDDVNFQMEDKEIHALLGENGAGKTTLMNILYGLYEKDSGSVSWQEKEVDIKSPKDAINYRIGMVHQHFMLVPTLSVSENITLGLKSKGYPFVKRKELNEEIKNLSIKYSLEIDPEEIVSNLSVGEQQRVEIMKLLYRDVKLLILDEPTAVLTPQEVEGLFKILDRLKEHGHSIVIITHKIPEVLAIADRITVLRDGKSVATVNISEVDAKSLADHMIGRQLKKTIEKVDFKVEGDNIGGLNLSRVVCKDALKNRLDIKALAVKPGEIFGLAGVDGNGQKELAEVILGIRKYEGEISLNGSSLDKLRVKDRKRSGIAYISDDRHSDGLLMNMDLLDNMIFTSNLKKEYVRKGFLNSGMVSKDTSLFIEEYNIKTPGVNVPVRYLSGGNQQKLILARELNNNPKLIVAFQPTRGLDVGASEFIREKLLEKRKDGCSILLISADLEEIRMLSDRIGVIYDGRLMDVMVNDNDINLTDIGLLMAGKEVNHEK